MSKIENRLQVGDRVRLIGQHAWAVVADWPDGAPEDLNRLQATFVAVRLERRRQDEEERLQFWPRKQILHEGESDPPPALPGSHARD